MKKSLSALLMLAFLSVFFFTPASAIDLNFETVLIQQGKIIPQNVAEVLAELFVQSNLDTGKETAWNDYTGVSSTKILYDEKGMPSAYSVELETEGKDTGYIVISAYPDMENYILEYADASKPLYDAFLTDETETIVYTGNLQYYQQTKDNILLDLQGEEVAAENIVNAFDNVRDEDAIEKARISAQMAYNASKANFSLFSSGGMDNNGTIVDPMAYIAAEYRDAEDMVAYEWKTLESHVQHRTTNSFSRKNSVYDYTPVTAITNIIEMTGNLKNISTIKNSTIQNVFSSAEKIGMDGRDGRKNYFWATDGRYTAGSGGIWGEMALAKYGVSIHSTTLGKFGYTQIKSELDKNRPFLLSTDSYGNYGRQVVAVYAYTRFRNTRSGNYKSFIKVADGRSNAGRYIDLSFIVDKPITSVEIFTIEYK